MLPIFLGVLYVSLASVLVFGENNLNNKTFYQKTSKEDEICLLFLCTFNE